MIHLNGEPNLESPEDIGMLQDSELDLVVGGFLGTAIQNAKSRALGLENVTEGLAIGYNHVELSY
jgi:hypothetical protein